MTTESTSLRLIRRDFNRFLIERALSLQAPLRPVEDILDRVIDFSIESVNKVLEGPGMEVFNVLRERGPQIPALDLPTPFGGVRTGALGLPEIQAIKLDPRKREAFKATIAIDLSSLIGLVPLIGDVIADVTEDTFGAKLRDLLSTEEMNFYTEFDKTGPSTLALARAFTALGTRR